MAAASNITVAISSAASTSSNVIWCSTVRSSFGQESGSDSPTRPMLDSEHLTGKLEDRSAERINDRSIANKTRPLRSGFLSLKASVPHPGLSDARRKTSMRVFR